MLGVALLSFFVWQHHLFVSGMNADLRPFYMLSTELISIPTGFIFACAMGTVWRGKLRYDVPMLFCLGWIFNFLIGGLSGVFLSDVPSDVTTHGSFFSLAHFHYTIVGGLLFTFFAAIYYWLPKMTGVELNQTLGKVHFWIMFIAFNSTFAPLFAVGFLGQPRRVVTYPSNLQFLNDWASVSAFVLGALDADLPLQPRLVARVQARARDGEPVAVEVARVPGADAGARLRLRPHPGDRLRPVPVRDRAGAADRGPGRSAGGGAMMSDIAQPHPAIEPEPPALQERNIWVGARLLVSSTIFLFLPFFFGYLYLATLNTGGLWRPDDLKGPLGWGLAIMLALLFSAGLARVGAVGARRRERGPVPLVLARRARRSASRPSCSR